MIKITFWFLFFLVCRISDAQNAPAYANFSASSFEGKVYLSWVLPAGSTCFGIQVYRSPDGAAFNEIGWFYGICGSNTESVPYSFIDEQPLLNQINYYRIELGLGYFSEIISVQVIDLAGNSSKVRPNPVVNTAVIFFMNEPGKSYTLSVFDLSGKLLSSQSTHLDFFEVNASSISPGLYLYTIKTEDSDYISAGKLIIAK